MSAQETFVEGIVPIEQQFAIGRVLPESLTTIIHCKNIVLKQDSIGIEIDASDAFKRVDTIIINGVEFVKRSKANNDL